MISADTSSAAGQHGEHYDLVVNTDTIPIEQAVGLIVDAATDQHVA